MKNLQVLTFIVVIMIGMLGCEKVKVENEASGDVFVKAIKDANGTTVFTAIHSMFSYNNMASVSVKAPDGLSESLTSFDSGGNSFFNEPVESDFVQVPPTPGAYVYTVKFQDGEEKTYTNTLTASTIQPALITSLAKSADGDSVYISWNAITSTDAYQLKISRGTTQVYYQPAFQDGSTPKKANLRIGMLLSALTAGVTGAYTFELTGLLFENTNYEYLQAISTSKQDITL